MLFFLSISIMQNLITVDNSLGINNRLINKFVKRNPSISSRTKEIIFFKNIPPISIRFEIDVLLYIFIICLKSSCDRY